MTDKGQGNLYLSRSNLPKLKSGHAQRYSLSQTDLVYCCGPCNIIRTRHEGLLQIIAKPVCKATYITIATDSYSCYVQTAIVATDSYSYILSGIFVWISLNVH